ncbi:hypothetical protein N7468_004325 [Penicillium chermesinum]|uniref:Rab-GAP TBC domain-containing protein n=1 Tax=Penicillium chermesinum TaxID=63820 RepID=A0A9W9TSG5_9EURO|nr:uncharacterized protein N7468_004325 [Penicillium chermesinum]KAJ5239706.1 hypothetical protein N7468_004325 [Penicillium chermesinum]
MVNETPATSTGSESPPTIRAAPVPYEDTLPGDRPVAIRSVSLPAPNDTPPDPNGRSLSTSAASPGSERRPASSREHLKNHGNEGLAPPTTEAQPPSPTRERPPLGPPSRPGSRPGSRWSERKWNGLRKRSGDFDRNGINTDIPTGSLDGLAQSMKFTTHGSLIRPRNPLKPVDQQSVDQSDRSSIQQSIQLDGGSTSEISPSPSQGDGVSDTLSVNRRLSQSNGTTRQRPKLLNTRAISSDEDMLSRRVRLMYERGDDRVTDADVAKSMKSGHSDILEENSNSDIETVSTPAADMIKPPPGDTGRASAEVERNRLKRETEELAGGVEYWQNVGAEQVDRYGFIHAAPTDSGSEPHPIQRVTTSLLLASETPRRRRSIRPPTALASNRSFSTRSPTRNMSQSSNTGRPSSSASTNSAPIRRNGSRLRSATNHLPHNRDRKVTDEAADMLTLPIEEEEATEGKDTPAARAARKKEWEREDKWTKMAKPVKKSRDGGGMKFEFDTRSPKLIERTWKGIPDRWRSTAWYSFLEASASRHADSPSEEDLINAFHEFQYMSSPDDMQIDIDVPRTISSHIMFRRRYRGGQRLLFRVLHAMSLYFPDTGYVQGMAAITATLLAYYDEEHAFVMLARLWKLRGLEQLYKSGFAGLMEALDDFEREWLAGGEVATQLTEVGIPPTAYGTRWYLTLFNYSIPFPAQLRVWDVFMLLGDAEDPSAHSRPPTSGKGGKKDGGTFGQGLDVLHATSAALIDGMRDIILESDFENIMKVLTSWVPIKDVEVFMRVAKTEYKVHRRKKTA